MDFAWRLDATPQDTAALAVTMDNPTEVEDEDLYGLEVLEAEWQGPAIGRVKPTVDVNCLSVGKYVVLVAPGPDEYTFTVEGQQLWLGRVSLTCTAIQVRIRQM